MITCAASSLCSATPYFTVTDPDGRFRLTGLPAGNYTLKIWIDSRTTREKPVELKAGRSIAGRLPVSPPRRVKPTGMASYRAKLLIAMMLVVLALTSLGLFLAQRKVAFEAHVDLLQDFRNELATLHAVREMRHAALVHHVGDLVKRPRIHAALEDNAIDLLYPTARDELRELVEREGEGPSQSPLQALHAKFYRFLDREGRVIPPPNLAEVGGLEPDEEAQLKLPSLSTELQIGYMLRARRGGASEPIDEVIAMPVFSSENGQVTAMLALGFSPVKLGLGKTATEIKSGVWTSGRMNLPALNEAEQIAVGRLVEKAVASSEPPERSREVEIGGVPHLLFHKQLNHDSLFRPAYEVALYPLTEAMARQRQIRRQVILSGALLLLAGFAASHLLAQRLSKPVEMLEVTSEQNRTQRERAEAALETTSEELQRAARFSSDASHQLKTPVSVLRVGIEELLARNDLKPEVYHGLSALLHQTYRMTGMVNDLLLLSRMDAGRLQIQFEPVNLSQLIEEWIDDLSALPDDLHIELKTNFPPDLQVRGEKRYISVIMQNLLENARKYNRPGGQICVSARGESDFVILSVENTGKPIPSAARDHIFERFHRGTVGENVPGHGLGLNLARELARLHGGDLRLVRSDAEWTEFEVRFRPASVPVLEVAHVA